MRSDPDDYELLRRHRHGAIDELLVKPETSLSVILAIFERHLALAPYTPRTFCKGVEIPAMVIVRSWRFMHASRPADRESVITNHRFTAVRTPHNFALIHWGLAHPTWKEFASAVWVKNLLPPFMDGSSDAHPFTKSARWCLAIPFEASCVLRAGARLGRCAGPGSPPPSARAGAPGMDAAIAARAHARPLPAAAASWRGGAAGPPGACVAQLFDPTTCAVTTSRRSFLALPLLCRSRMRARAAVKWTAVATPTHAWQCRSRMQSPRSASTRTLGPRGPAIMLGAVGGAWAVNGGGRQRA